MSLSSPDLELTSISIHERERERDKERDGTLFDADGSRDIQSPSNSLWIPFSPYRLLMRRQVQYWRLFEQRNVNLPKNWRALIPPSDPI